nr:hypothetical protein [Tanacetum cinerariifolium]
MSFKEIQDFLRCLLEVRAFEASQVVLGAVVFLAADRFLFFLFESKKVNVSFVNGEAGLDVTLLFLTSNVSLISTTPILSLRSSAVEGTSIDPCVETTDITEAQLDAISEGEVDQTFSSSSNANNLVSLNVQSAASKSFRTLMFPLLL